MWIFCGTLDELFPARVARFSYLGWEGINWTFGTAIRTTAVLVITWLFVWGAGVRGTALHVYKSQAIYLLLSALATGGAWICYNRAWQEGPATRVASIDKLSIVLIALLSWMVFKEDMSTLAVVSSLLLTAGSVLLAVAWRRGSLF